MIDRPEQIAQDLLWQLAHGSGRSGYLPTFAAHRRHRLPDRLVLDRQVLVVHGERDRLITSEDLTRCAAAVPRAGIVRIPGAGHMPHVEGPREFNATLSEFLPDYSDRIG